MSNSFNFSRSRIEAIINDSSKDIEYGDTGKKGLIIRVSPAGKKVFRLKAWNRTLKRTEQMVLGTYPDISIAAARTMVDKALHDMATGVDMVEDRKKAARAEMTLHDAFLVYIARAMEKNKRWEQDQRRYELYIEPHLGRKKVSDVTPELVEKWRSKLLQQKRRQGGTLSKGTVQRAVIVLRAIFSSGAKHVSNPCSEIDHFQPSKRLIFMKSDQLAKFYTAVQSLETPDYLRDFVLISLYTGARRSNIEAMQWEHLDLNAQLWVIPGDEMKNTEPHVVPLLEQAAEILRMRKALQLSPVWVFPSVRKGKTGHLVEPKKAWYSLVERAELPKGFRMHDLRRTMGSWQAITGASTKIIGASLGHKTEQATAHYAHLIVDPVRASMQKAADAMDEQKNVAPETLTPEGAAKILGVQTSTLASWRSSGKGPKFMKYGNRIVYRTEDVHEFIAKGRGNHK